MNSATTCPTDEELIPMLVGESADPSVASHLHACSTCRRRLEMFQSDLAALRLVSINVPEFVPPPARPSRIGKYLIVGALDSGGQADVYRAVHPTLDTELAIKLSRRAVGRLSDHRPLLVAEGKMLAKLDHPGLARIYDLDFHDDLPFLAMEYVRGANLRQYAAEAPVSPRAAAGIVAQVARALAVVHRHGIVHQDVKPQNILIDETGRPRLIDFGLARLRHAWDDSGDRAGGGTPAFMAPEQARNNETAVGPRSDVFALGGVLYFLLTGKLPFQGDTMSDTLARAGRCEFDRAALDKPGVPRGLRDICLKAMAAAPADRFPRADDFAHALEHHLARPQRVRRLAIMSVAAALVVGLGAVVWMWPKADPTQAVVNAEKPAAPPALEVVVSRGDKALDLPAALPLQPDGDAVQVIGRVPPGHHAVLLRVTAKGAVKTLPFRESPADGYTKLVFPKEEGTVATFKPGERGTEFVLLCSAEKAETLDGLELLVTQLLTRVRTGPDEIKARESLLPALPPKMLVWLGRDEPTRQSMGFDATRADNATQVVDQLDQLRQRLRDLPLSVLRGVAYTR